MLDFTGLNWWAILVATATAFILGFFWYGPVFGKAWVAALGKTEDEIQPSPTPFIVSVVAALVICIVVAALLKGLGMSGGVDGAVLGLVTGIGFIGAWPPG